MLRRFVDRWGVLTTVAFGFAAAGAILVTGFVVLIVIALIAFHPFDFGPGSPTPAELAEAATTSSIPATGCRSFRVVEHYADVTQQVLFTNESAPGWNAQMDLALAVLDAKTREAERYAQGPMRTHLAEMRRAIAHSRRQIASGDAQTVFGDALDGYTNLETADALLGRTCGGRLSPELSPGAAPTSVTSTP